jgi:hypothetical protein
MEQAGTKVRRKDRMKAAPRRAKKSVKPAKAAKPRKAVKPAKAAKRAAGKKPAAAKRASRAAKPVVQKPVQKKVETRAPVPAPAVEKRPFWGFLGIGRKQKTKVSIMELQGKK